MSRIIRAVDLFAGAGGSWRVRSPSRSAPSPPSSGSPWSSPKGVDVRFRILQPHELSAAMGFPEDYQFVGTKTDTVRMIGNAWSIRTAEALCHTLLANIGAAPAVDVDAEAVA